MNTDENATTQELDTTPSETQATGANDPADVKASDLLKELEGGSDEEAELKTDESDADDSAEPETDDGDEGDEDDEAPEDADDDDDANVPSLDTAIEQALAEHAPDLIKRWGEQWKGLAKREAKMKDWETGIQDLFADPEYAREVVPAFIGKVAAAHGVTVEELVGLTMAQTQTAQDGEPNLDDYDDYYSWHLAHEAWSRAQVSDNAELAALKAKIAQMEAAQLEQARQAEHQKVLDQQLGRVQKVFEKEFAGFKVTRKMLADAVAEYPSHDPIKAVKAANVDKLTTHMSKVVAERGRVNAPVMPKGGVGKGVVLPSGDNLKARDLLPMLDK